MTPGRAAIVAAGIAASAVVFGGCIDGTVRNPPGEAKGTEQGDGGKQGGGKDKGGGGEGADGESKGEGISFAAVGDVAMGITPMLPPSPSTYFDAVAGELSADVVFGNLEGTLTDVEQDLKGCEDAKPGTCFAFRAPPEYAKYLSNAGFNVMSLANNHSFDFGEAGQEETVGALYRAGIEPVGIPGRLIVLDVDGTKVAFLGFASYGYTNSLTDLDAARALIRQARKRADLVVVVNHAGAEGSDALHVTGETEMYFGEDRGNPEEFAHMAVEAGADLVLGSGPHVLRGIEVYRDRLIAYSLGNFSGYDNFSLEGVLGETVVLHATLAPGGRFRSGRLASVQMIEDGRPVPDPDGSGAALVEELSQDDFAPSKAIKVGPDGRIEAP